jgi:YD repeat-containing protein
MKRTVFFGMLIAVCFCTAFYAEAVVINYSYDDAGRLIKADYGGETAVQYVYDTAGNLLRQDIMGISNVKGDVDGDKEVTLTDAVLSLKTQAGYADPVNIAADADGDKQIGTAEAVFVLDYLSK